MDYETVRNFSGTWGLLYLVAVFVIVVAWIFRPGSSKIYDEQARIPFHHDED